MHHVNLIASLAIVFVMAAPAGAATLTTLASFSGINGSQPYSTLVADAAGTLYGTTVGGGGTVFSLSRAGALTTLVSFNNANGLGPYGGLVIDAAGRLHGTTRSGGPSFGGTLFRVAPDGTFTTLAAFGGGPASGLEPWGTLHADASGTVYGTTRRGGAYGSGTVFGLAADGTFTTLHSFVGTAGAEPFGGVIADASGNLCGTTVGDGAGYPARASVSVRPAA